MKVYVHRFEERGAYPGEHPAVVLRPDTWDDYGFRTTFHVSLWIDRVTALEVGSVKIMLFDMGAGQTALEPFYGDGLPEGYASLGTDMDYYDHLSRVDDPLGGDVLDALKDIAVNDTLYQSVQTQHAYSASLVRLAPARDALRRVRAQAISPAPLPVNTASLNVTLEPIGITASASTGPSPSPATIILEGVKAEASAGSLGAGARPALKFTFTPPQSERKQLEPGTITFDFDGPQRLPSSVIVLIGPNGTGKTSLLSDIALSLFFGDRARSDTRPSPGVVDIGSGSVRDVIFVSYSAYDTFEIPDLHSHEADRLEGLGYVYVGLRQLSDGKASDPESPQVLKATSEIAAEFRKNLAALQAGTRHALGEGRPDRRLLFATAVRTLFKDPSIARIAPLPPTLNVDGVIGSVSKLFPSLSTGHKAMLNILAALCRYLNVNSLVLMDEPEAHLHPPLVAALLKTVREILQAYRAHAVVATHSPVIVQETLARHVIMLDRVDHVTSWKISRRETFGENIAALTREAFGLPAEGADFIGSLQAIIDTDTQLEDIERLFKPWGLTSPARAQVLRIISDVQARHTR